MNLILSSLVHPQRATTNDITPHMHRFPRRSILLIALLDTLSLVVMVIAGASTPPVLSVLFMQVSQFARQRRRRKTLTHSSSFPFLELGDHSLHHAGLPLPPPFSFLPHQTLLNRTLATQFPPFTHPPTHPPRPPSPLSCSSPSASASLLPSPSNVSLKSTGKGGFSSFWGSLLPWHPLFIPPFGTNSATLVNVLTHPLTHPPTHPIHLFLPSVRAQPCITVAHSNRLLLLHPPTHPPTYPLNRHQHLSLCALLPPRRRLAIGQRTGHHLLLPAHELLLPQPPPRPVSVRPPPYPLPVDVPTPGRWVGRRSIH